MPEIGLQRPGVDAGLGDSARRRPARSIRRTSPRISQRRGSTFAGFGSSTEASGGRSCAAAWWTSIPASACSISPRIEPRRHQANHRVRASLSLSLTLNTSALVENIRLADLDRHLGICGRVGHFLVTAGGQTANELTVSAQSWRCDEFSSVTEAHHKAGPRQSADSRARRYRLEQSGRNRAPPNMSNGSSRRHSRMIPWRSHIAVPASGRKLCGALGPSCDKRFGDDHHVALARA